MILLAYTLMLGLLSVVGQMFMPEIQFLGSARPALPVLAIIFAAVCLRDLRVFWAVIAVGFYHDMLCPNRLGISVIALSLVAALVLTQTHGRLLQRLDFQMLVVLVASFLYLSLTYLFYLLQIRSASSTASDWALITYGSLMNTLLAPLLLPLLQLPMRLFGWKPSSRSDYTGYAAQ